MFEKLSKWWWFHMANPIVRKGEAGGFKWKFRRFWLDIETVSGNFKARFMAAEHPYAYLLAGQTDDNIHGFCQTIYMVGMLLTTDQGFVSDVGRAIQKYDKRLQKANPVVEDETEEKIALEEVKQVQEYVEMDEKSKKKRERETNGRFKKAVKDLEKSE
jgi:hypothetical protein